MQTLSSLLREVYSEATNIDSRIWQTVLRLFQPGLMARDWIHGQGAEVFPPVRLYVVASTLFFLVGGGLLVSLLVADTIKDGIPAEAIVGLDVDQIRTSVEVRLTGWLALMRIASLLPLALLIAPLVAFGVATGFMKGLLGA